MASQVKDRAYVSDISISIGPIAFVGDLLTLTIPNVNKDAKFVMTCPVCVTKVTQQYVCNHDAKHIMLPAECGKAKEADDGTLTAVSADQVKAAKESTRPVNELKLHIHRASEVALVPNGSTYIFRSKVGEFYGLLLDLIDKHPELAFAGVVNHHNTDHLVRLTRGLGGQLLLQEAAWPQDLKTLTPPSYSYSEKDFAMAEKIVDSLIEDFNPDDYKPEARERLAALVGANGVVTAPEPAEAAAEPDMESILKAALDAIQQGKS